MLKTSASYLVLIALALPLSAQALPSDASAYEEDLSVLENSAPEQDAEHILIDAPPYDPDATDRPEVNSLDFEAQEFAKSFWALIDEEKHSEAYDLLDRSYTDRHARLATERKFRELNQDRPNVRHRRIFDFYTHGEMENSYYANHYIIETDVYYGYDEWPAREIFVLGIDDDNQLKIVDFYTLKG